MLIKKIILHFFLTIIYFFIFTPISIFLKILNKDLLKLKKNNNNTYWIAKSKNKSKMKSQF